MTWFLAIGVASFHLAQHNFSTNQKGFPKGGLSLQVLKTACTADVFSFVHVRALFSLAPRDQNKTCGEHAVRY